MATVPSSMSEIRILENVPFNMDYQDTRWLKSLSEQISYFDSFNKVYSGGEYKTIYYEGRSSVKVNVNYDKLMKANYIMFQNKEWGDKWFYAFITDKTMISANATEVFIKLDTLQTYRFDFEIKPSFVVREHCPLWDNEGRPMVNTIDEGLNYGLEYDDVHVTHFIPNSGIKFLVLIATKMLHGTDKDKSIATYNGTAQPLAYYVLPVTLTGAPIKLMSGGNDIPMSSPEKFLSTVYDNENSQKTIVSIYMTDSIGCPFEVRGGGETSYNITFTESDQKLEAVRIGEGDKVNDLIYVKDIKRYKTEEFAIEGRYEHLPNYRESKLYMYPYTVLTMDDFKGNRHDYKLEYINDGFINLNVKGSIGTENYVTYGVKSYNNRSNATNHQDNQYAVINNTPQDVPILNDLYAAYLQGNRNQLKNQQDSIVFNGVMNSASSMFGGVNAEDKGRGGFGNNTERGLGVVQGMGNTVLQLQGMEAKKQDIRNIPQQLSKQGSNTAYSFGHRYDGITLIKKTLKPEYAKKLTDFFNMFGYKKNEVKLPNLTTRKSFNFIQTKGIKMKGRMDNTVMEEIKNIFNSGITLWHTNDIGNYDLDNSEV